MSDKIVKIDVTALAHYLEKVGQLSSINKMMGPTYLKDFIEGQDVAGMLLARAIREDGKTKARLEQAKAIAFLDRSGDYLTSKGFKITDEARKRYMDLDEDVMVAADAKAQTEALVSLLKNKLSILKQAHDDLKKILYGDTSMTQWEGM
jgi:hypothetical protein